MFACRTLECACDPPCCCAGLRPACWRIWRSSWLWRWWRRKMGPRRLAWSAPGVPAWAAPSSWCLISSWLCVSSRDLRERSREGSCSTTNSLNGFSSCINVPVYTAPLELVERFSQIRCSVDYCLIKGHSLQPRCQRHQKALLKYEHMKNTLNN